MHHLWTVVSLGLATNLDNLCIALLLGLQGRRLGKGYNLLVSLSSGVLVYLCGQVASFAKGLGRWPGIIGGLILIGMGVVSLLPKRKNEADEPALAAAKPGLRGGLLLGWALSLNCIPVSFGAGLTGVNPVALAAGVAALSFVCVEVGNRVGLGGGQIKWGEKKLLYVSAVLMITMGIVEMFA